MRPRTPLARRALAAILIACAAALAASCARTLPTAVEPDVQPGREIARFTEGGGVLEQVVTTLAPGTDAQAVAEDYGAALVYLDAEHTLAAYAPPTGVSPDDLALAMTGDPRLTTQEANHWIAPPESRQKSFAFDDGQGTLQNAVEQPAAAAIGLPAAHRASTGGGVKVAVLDTGIDPTHPLFAGRIVGTADFLDPANTGAVDVANGVDDDLSGAVDEAFGHGTHVAGIVSLAAPDAMLLVGRVLDADGRGDVLAVAAGIRWAVRQGARVINLSLGTTAHSDAIERALDEAEDAGVLVFASAGNRGTENPTEYPARSRRVIAVAASDASRHPASFTSYGPFVKLSAPGVAVRSAYPGGQYRLWSGTSMATPFVAGTAALLLSLHPQWDEEEVVERLEESALDLTGVPYAQREKLGKGMLGAGDALLPEYRPGITPGEDPEELLRRPR